MTSAIRIFQGGFGRVALMDIGQRLVAHAHPHCHVLIKLGGADSALRVGERFCPLTDDTMVLVNVWERHAYMPHPSAGSTLILALYIEPSWLMDTDRAFAWSGRPGFFARPLAPVTRDIRASAEKLALAMGREGEDEDEDEDEDGGGGDEEIDLLHDLMVKVTGPFSRWRNDARACSTSDFRIRKALEHMRCNLGGAFTLEDVAREAGLSRAQLFRGFQSHLGITPMIYFNSLRMEAAVRSLAEEDERLSHVADRLGFSMQCHFTRFFRANLGITPSQYRRVVRVQAPEWQRPPRARLSA